MSTTVTYEGSTIATVENNTKTLQTKGKYLTDDITLVDTSQSGFAAISITDEPDSHGGTIRHINGVDISDSTIDTDKVLSGYVGYKADGTRIVGTASAGITPSGTKQISINTNGTTTENVTSYASVEIAVNVPTGTARTSADLTVSGAIVTVPAGLYSEQATKSVASGTEGTPVATKGTVSNHAVSVTPSVTNTEGYISGGTKTGTAVSVSASELVSGTLTVDSSGTKDVTNYASASVPSGTAGTPSATKGTVSNHSVSVTPSVTNTTGWIIGSTKTGTAVSVSASELVSGSETKTANGTYDVTNLASLVVAVPIVTYYTGSSVPSSSLGSNGDIYLQTS